MFKTGISDLRKRVKMYDTKLTSIPQIKRVLVEPFLDLMGFSPSQPTAMEFDHRVGDGEVIDYILYKDEKPIVGVVVVSREDSMEASSFEPESAIYEMMRGADLEACIVTNGGQYDFYIKLPFVESLGLLFSFSLARYSDYDITLLETIKGELSEWVSAKRLVVKFKIYSNLVSRILGDSKKFMRLAINGAKLTELEKELALGVCEDLQCIIKNSLLDTAGEDIFELEFDTDAEEGASVVEKSELIGVSALTHPTEVTLAELTSLDIVSNKHLVSIRIKGFEVEVKYWRNLLSSAINYGINMLDMSPAEVVRSSPKSDWYFTLSQEAKEIKRGRIDYEGISYSGHGGAWALLSKFKKTMSAWGIPFSEVVLTIYDK